MKRYRFNLAAVLEVKKRREEAFVRQKGALEFEKSRIEMALKHWGGELSGLFNEVLAQRTGGKVSVSSEELALAREIFIKLKISALRQNLAEMEKQIEAARLKLVEASKEKRVLERLEERQWKEYLLESNREEQGFLDELAQHQFFHQFQRAF